MRHIQTKEKQASPINLVRKSFQAERNHYYRQKGTQANDKRLNSPQR
jgi:hypothetical protein